MQASRLYGWQLSYFTGKALCYLRHQRVDFELCPVDLFTLTRRIRRHTGAVVMPVLVTPAGEWIHDTSRIVDHGEAHFGGPTVHPAAPVMRFASFLMEAWGDEWWVPMAMYTRWTHDENYPLFEREAGAALLPALPGFVQRRAAATVARRLRGMLPAVGVRPEQHAAMDAWMATMLDRLDAHFAHHPFLFGPRPMLGDFGLVGTMLAHLGRDPWPARELIAPRPRLRAWIDRMADPGLEAPPGPDASVESTLPAPTLTPVFEAIAREFVPLLDGIAAQVRELLVRWPAGRPLPRGLGDVEVPMGRARFRRAALPYTLWMAQRVLDAYRAMAPGDRAEVEAWLASIGGAALLRLEIPRLRLHGVRVAAA